MRRLLLGPYGAARRALPLAAACSTAACAADTVLLALDNQGPMPVWLEPERPRLEPRWLELRGSRRVLLLAPTSCEPECGPDFGSDGACHGRTDPAFAHELLPGTSMESEWNGGYWVYDAAAACWASEQAEADEELTASFCWGQRYRLAPEGVGTSSVASTRAERRFVRSRDSEVRYALTAAPVELTMKLVLQNMGTAPIYVQSGNGCEPAQPTWFQVSFDGVPLQLFPRCGVCSCPAGPGPCESDCGTCADPTATVLGHHDFIEYEWNGLRYEQRSDPACEQLAPAPVGPLSVELCWGMNVWPSGQVTEPQCQSTEAWLGANPEVAILVGG